MSDSPQLSKVLIVDDDEAITRLLIRRLCPHGYAVQVAHDGPSALSAVRDDPPDVVLLDVMIPIIDGYEVCRRLKRDPATRLLPVVLVTGLTERAQRIEGLKAGADDFLSKPVDIHELLARVGSLLRMKRYTDDLDSAASIIETLAEMIEARDGYTQGHCHRMANYATALGRKLRVSEDDLQALQRGGFLHDIGMLAIPDPVLKKEGKLSPEEYELVKSHTVIGDSLCGKLRSLSSVRPIVRHHHERFDGSGYPDGLRGDDIPLVAQIVGIIDVYDAVTTRRSYQQPKPTDAAGAILRRQVEHGWRRHDLVEEFITMIRGGGFVIS
ncbi:MAG: metal-dependent phosphohydrolase [Acidobacteria bacterium]|nr:MAG: metal-dependent phosphohydrolase [Acidobacteriota bacterium]